MMTSPTHELTRRLFDVDEFERMVDAGVLDEDDRVELIAGEVITMTQPNAPHDGTINRLNRLLTSRYGARAIVHVQNSLHVDDHNLFLPDVCLLRDRADFYSTRRPTPADVLLAIEVSDSTLRKDRKVKLPIYAAAGIRELWIVDTRAQVVHRHYAPDPSGYGQSATYARDDVIPLPAGGGTARVADVTG